MDKDGLVELLKDAADAKGRDGAYRFERQRSATVLVGAEGSLVTIDRVTRMCVKAAYVAIETDRSDRFYVDPRRIVGIRLHEPDDNTGFLSR